jgi:DNA-binding phage protein
MNTPTSFSKTKRTIRAARASAQIEWSTRQAMFAQAVQALFIGREDLAKVLIRDVINGNLGFESLAVSTGIPSKSLHRMLSKNGNPTSKNLFQILRSLSRADGFEIQIQVVKPLSTSGV